MTHFLRENRDPVLETWLGNRQVRQRLESRAIGAVFFRNQFALRIYDHLEKIASGEERGGSCPAVTEMLAFLQSKHVPLTDLFFLCTNLKNALLKRAAMIGAMEHFDDIARMLDANLEYVMLEYLRIGGATVPAGAKEEEAAGEELIFLDAMDAEELEELESSMNEIVQAISAEDADEFRIAAMATLLYDYAEVLAAYPIFSGLAEKLTFFAEKFRENAAYVHQNQHALSVLLEEYFLDLVFIRTKSTETGIGYYDRFVPTLITNVDMIVAKMGGEEEEPDEDFELF